MFKTILSLFFLFATLTVTTYSQESTTELQVNVPVTIRLTAGDSSSFLLQLKKKSIADISWLVNESANFEVRLTSPGGRDLTKDFGFEDDGIAFVAPDDGAYTLTFTYKKTESSPYLQNANEPQSVTVSLRNTFTLPAGSKMKSFRQINGYTVRIAETSSKSNMSQRSVLLIERAGKIEGLLRSPGGPPAGFRFADECDWCSPIAKGSPPEWISAAREILRSVSVIKATPDKTGDGIPDVMVTHYSGGAHCCTTTLFAELGDQVRFLPSIYTGNGDVVRATRNPRGGLLLKIGDDSFAYWGTSFAASPMPEVILEYRNQMFRPAFALMKKAPPPLAELKEKARKDSRYIGSEQYTGTDSADFEHAFWAEMLDLIYSGNESLAWQYLDLVWPVGKRGKERFKNDFVQQLNSSPYWKMIQDDER